MIPKPIAYLAQESTSPGQARRAIDAGFKSVALQLGVATKEAVKVARDAGLFVAIWGPVGGAVALPEGARGFIPQVESPGQFSGAITALSQGAGKGLELAIVTTYWGLFDPDAPTSGSKWKQLAALGVTEAHVECYAADGFPHADLNRMLGQGEIYGIPKNALVPVIGTYRGETPDDYSGLAERVPNFGIYIIEQTGQDTLDALKKLVLQPAPKPVLVSASVTNAEISRLAHTWLDQQDDYKPLTRLRLIERIANSTDNEWVTARSRVKSALDSVGA